MNERELYNDELRKAPFLDALKKEEVFGVPEDYFEQLPENLKNRLQGDEDQEQIYSWGEIRGDGFFETPQEYFDQLPGKIRQRILALPVSPQARGKLKASNWLNPFALVAVAASLALLVILGYRILNNSPGQSLPPIAEENTELLFEESLAEVPMEQILAAIDIENYSLDMIIEAMEEEDLAALPGVYGLELSEDEISDLIDEVDLNDWEEALIERSSVE